MSWRHDGNAVCAIAAGTSYLLLGFSVCLSYFAFKLFLGRGEKKHLCEQNDLCRMFDNNKL